MAYRQGFWNEQGVSIAVAVAHGAVVPPVVPASQAWWTVPKQSFTDAQPWQPPTVKVTDRGAVQYSITSGTYGTTFVNSLLNQFYVDTEIPITDLNKTIVVQWEHTFLGQGQNDIINPPKYYADDPRLLVSAYVYNASGSQIGAYRAEYSGYVFMRSMSGGEITPMAVVVPAPIPAGAVKLYITINFYGYREMNGVAVDKLRFTLSGLRTMLIDPSLLDYLDWADISCDVQSLDIRHGREQSTERFDTGTFTVNVRNTDGKYRYETPDKQPVRLQPGSPVRVEATHNGITYPMAWGFLDDIRQEYSLDGKQGVGLVCYDASSLLASYVGIPGVESAGNLWELVNNFMVPLTGWSRASVPGPGAQNPIPADGDGIRARQSPSNRNMRDYLGLVADTCDGEMFSERDGTLVVTHHFTKYDADEYQKITAHLDATQYDYGPVTSDGYLDSRVGTISSPGVVLDRPFRIKVKVLANGATVGPDQFIAGQWAAATDSVWFLGARPGQGGLVFGAYNNAVPPVRGDSQVMTNAQLLEAAPDGLVSYIGTEQRPYRINGNPTQSEFNGIASEDGEAWNVVRSNVSGSWPMNPVAALVRVGAHVGGAGTPWLGRIYWAECEALPAVSINLPGLVGNYLSVPDRPALDITGDLEVVMRVSIDVLLTAGINRTLMAKASEATTRSWQFVLNSSGGLTLLIWNAAGTSSFVNSTVALSSAGYSNGQWVWLKATFRASDSRVQFFHAPGTYATEPTAWTQLGTNGTLTGITDIRSGASFVEIGTRLAGTTEPLAMKVGRAIIRNGIAGTMVLNLHSSMIPSDTVTSFNVQGGPGEIVTVTVNQTAGQKLLNPLPAELLWRFDANEYPGTGLSYVDPRGRTWTLTTAAAIVPKVVPVPAVPDMPNVVDVCPKELVSSWNTKRIINQVKLANADGTQFSYGNEESQEQYGTRTHQRLDLVGPVPTGTQAYDDPYFTNNLTWIAERLLTQFQQAQEEVSSVVLDARQQGSPTTWPWMLSAFLNWLVSVAYHFPAPPWWGWEVVCRIQSVQHQISPKNWDIILALDQPQARQPIYPQVPSLCGWDVGKWDQVSWDQTQACPVPNDWGATFWQYGKWQPST